MLKVQDEIGAEDRVFLDPNALSKDGTVAVRGYCFSENGRLFAYGLSTRGSDWVTIRVSLSNGSGRWGRTNVVDLDALWFSGLGRRRAIMLAFMETAMSILC